MLDKFLTYRYVFCEDGTYSDWGSSLVNSAGQSASKIRIFTSRTSRIHPLVRRDRNLVVAYASQFSSFFLSFSPLWLEFGKMSLSFTTFADSDISCVVDDLAQPIEWFYVGPIKSSLLLHLILVAGTPLSRDLVYTLRHDAWYFASQENRPKPLICLTFSSPPFSTVIFTPPSRLKTRTQYAVLTPSHFLAYLSFFIIKYAVWFK